MDKLRLSGAVMRACLSIIFTITVVSCATAQKSAIFGAVIGGVIGGSIANSVAKDKHNNQPVLIGTTVGASVGGLIGYSAFREQEKKEREKTLQKNPFESQTPSLTAPKVRRVWVPARIENEKFIDGHYMYIIEKTSSWSE